MRRKGGSRRKTRGKLKKHVRDKGKLSVGKYFQKFEAGERVALVPEPSIQKGLYFRRYIGKTGIVIGKEGVNYRVLIKDNNKEKVIVTPPIHLKDLNVKAR